MKRLSCAYLILSLLFYDCVMVAAMAANEPVPGMGIRRFSQYLPSNPDFDESIDDAFYTCDETGWNMAQAHIAMFSEKDNGFMQNLELAGIILANVKIIYLWMLALPFIGLLAYGTAVAASYAIHLTLNLNAFNKFTDRMQSQVDKLPEYSDDKFVSDTEVLTSVGWKGMGGQSRSVCIRIPLLFTSIRICQSLPIGIFVFKYDTEPLNNEDMTNFVGILQNLTGDTGANMPVNDGLDRPVSNSAHGLCHIIRCARDYIDNGVDPWIDADDPEQALCKEFFPNNIFESDFFNARTPDGKYIQDLKNYLALSEMKRAKYIAKKQLQPAPFADISLVRGVSGNLLSGVNDDIANNSDNYFFSHVFANIKGTTNNQTILRRRLSNFCSDVESSYCSPVSMRFTEQKQFGDVILPITKTYQLNYPDDFLSMNLFDHSMYANSYVQYMSYELLNNLVSPTPITLMKSDDIFERDPDDELKSIYHVKYNFKEGGDKHLYSKYRLTSLLSQSHQSLHDMYVQRIPWATTTNSQLFATPNMSELSILDEESRRRMIDPEWHEMISIAGDEVVLKDVLTQMSTNLHIKYKMFEHVERVESLMATQLSTMFDVSVAMGEKGAQVAE